MSQDKNIYTEATTDYLTRVQNRTGTLGESTMVLLQQFVDGEDDYDTAKGKVQQLSDEITVATPGAKMDFILGRTGPLITQVQASVLSFMTDNNNANIDLVVNILNQVV